MYRLGISSWSRLVSSFQLKRFIIADGLDFDDRTDQDFPVYCRES